MEQPSVRFLPTLRLSAAGISDTSKSRKNSAFEHSEHLFRFFLHLFILSFYLSRNHVVHIDARHRRLIPSPFLRGAPPVTKLQGLLSSSLHLSMTFFGVRSVQAIEFLVDRSLNEQSKPKKASRMQTQCTISGKGISSSFLLRCRPTQACRQAVNQSASE